MKKVKKSEKEISQIVEREIQLSSKEQSIYSQIQSIRHELQHERRRGETLSKENSSIKKQLNKTQALVASLARLEEQYNTLVLKYERSEQIRARQSKMIHLLKSELYVRLGICKICR
jgi:chromosome segregation ATPase